jgi:hypothetical protein
MKRLVRGLGVLLAGCIILQVGAQLIQPVIPLLVVLFVMVLSGSRLLKRRP